ncbi:restriction endonuclease subunit S [Sphaerochaeta sp.]|uniref:restriction endonuclease subunit S n=1 Tax=Sphaerochaeta sp. TaxID=1972642 RepID=UPI003D0EF64B
MKSNYKRLGQYIREVSEKNTREAIDKLLGVSISKEFIPSIANTIGTDMSKYKIVRTNQFAYGPVTSRNGDKISVALLQESDCIISTSYTVFEIHEPDEMLPEYLMMWFRRPEFDRYARFMSHGSVREIFGWEEMCDVELPVPTPEKQQQIVDEYNTIVNRIKLNEKLCKKLEETAQSIYKHGFVDFEFPISAEYAKSIGKPELEGKPYKSSGGEMVYNAELDQEIPLGWRYESYTSIIDLKGGGTPSTDIKDYWDGDIPFFTPKDVGNTIYTVRTEKYITKLGFAKSSTKLYGKNTVFITARGTVGALSLPITEMAMNQSCYAAIGKNGIGQFFVHQHTAMMLYTLINEANGGVFGALVTKDFDGSDVIIPKNDIIKLFEETVSSIYESLENVSIELTLLAELKNTILSKMTMVCENCEVVYE